MKFLIKIFIILIFSGCGTRKTQISTQDIKLEETTKITEQTKLNIESNQTQVDTSSIYEECFEPINDTLPFTIKGQIYQNVRIKTSKIKKGISILNYNKSVLNQRKDSLNKTSIDKVSKEKVIDKKDNNFWLLLSIITIAIIILCYYDYKRQ